MDVTDNGRSRQRQDIVAAFQVYWVIDEAGTTEVLFTQLVLLNHCTHRTIEDEHFVGFLTILIFFHDAHGLFHFTLVMEVHFDVYAVTTDIVKQRAQLIECHPAGHDALAGSENLFVQVIPLRTAALWLADTGSPLDGVQFVYLQQGVKVAYGTNAVEVV